jgi:metal-sulfur cluster biosynthetic enzyme
MTDTTTDPTAPAAPSPATTPETTASPDVGADAGAFDASAGGAPFDPQRRATELAILDALRAVVDPEIGMNVVELALIKQIILGPDSTEVKMILTTPFCPYAGSMIQQVKDQAESVVDHDVKVTLLAERWDPRDAGLMW